MKLSIIIPSRGEFTNLKFTMQSMIDKLLGPFGVGEFEILAGMNFPTDVEWAWLHKLAWTKLGVIVPVRQDEVASCWQTRNACMKVAKGDYLFFADSHIITKADSLVRAIEWHKGWKGMLKFGNNYMLEVPYRVCYQYRWQPEKFWGAWSRVAPESPDYHIMMGGSHHMTDRSVYEEIGGWNPHLGIYGGGEPYMDFKMQMFGYPIRCYPEFQVYHLAERRGYAWNNDDLWRNFMVAAWAIGGEEAIAPLVANYTKACKGVERYLDRLVELKAEAQSLAEPDRVWIAEHAKRTWRDVLAEFGF